MPDEKDKPADQGGNKTSFGVDIPQTPSAPPAGGGMRIIGGMQTTTSGGNGFPPQSNPGSKTSTSITRPTSKQQYYTDPTAAVRHAIRGMGGRDNSGSWGGQSTSVVDMLQSMIGYKTGFQDTGRILTGVVQDGTAIANNYIVHPDHGHEPVIATSMSMSSIALFGPTELNTYLPGTRVIMMVQDKDHRAFIIGAIPHTLDCGKRGFQDYISQASRNRVDDCHKKHIKQQKSSNMADYSDWRPYDATLAGEWGSITSSGGRFFLDDFMFQAAVNEFCGIYGFYHDSMLRVAGYNMQVWTAGSERDSYMDQAECNDSQGYTPYPWEGMGVLEPGTKVIEEYEPGCFQCFKEKPYYSHWENKHEFAQPYHRSQVFFGYLGQGTRQLVHSPPKGQKRWTYKGEPGPKGDTPYDSKVEPRPKKPPLDYKCRGGPDKEKEHIENPVYGLNEENKALDGRLFLASAKGVHITKRILLPFPQRIKRPEDINNGDEASKNYKAASKFGRGPEHEITGTIKTTDNDYPNLQRATALLDLHGYLYNYSGLHAFFWHAKDYKTWEQQELKYADVNQKIPEFSELVSDMYLKEIQPKIFKIDHRYDKNPQKFYETESFISLLDDGGIVIGDGYGGEIRMSGGCVFISAPGDVWLKSGRDVQAWAGNDVITRANKTVDISATEKNIRIKAERNVLVLAGNESSDREGGILLESRSKTIAYDFEKCGDEIFFGGIVLRAPKSNVVNLAKQIYLRTGGGTVEEGDITIDVSKGNKNLVTKSHFIHNFLKKDGRVFHYFGGQKVGGTTKGNMFSEEATVLCGTTSIGQNLFINGYVLCHDSIFCHRGHIYTELSSRKGPQFVYPCDEKCQKEVGKGLDEFQNFTNVKIPEFGDKIDKVIQKLWYEKKMAGNDDVMTIMEFSFRKDDDYKFNDFLLYEDRWQQMSRIGGKAFEKWTERPVNAKACGKPTYPFPGAKWLQEEQAFKEQDFRIVQLEKGGYIDKERGKAPDLQTEYRYPEFKEPEKKVINGNYIITPRIP